ncbi:MAG: CbbQ/NirQ/NorQ C-terminal domain-containing protein [Polyangiaceae bacterium]|nr:CbbQ/NirQ/NorQ C-terminal domain-containing protein [Polyangiaceae bacterium]
MKELKPSTRQRFVALAFDYPPAEVESEILQGEAGIDARTAKKLATLAHKLRRLDALGLAEAPSTRLFIDAARLIKAGAEPRRACDAAIVQPLSDDSAIVEALSEVVALAF